MWSPWMSAKWNILRSDIVDENIDLNEIVGMWDAMKEMI
jgi:hypothetical protein